MPADRYYWLVCCNQYLKNTTVIGTSTLHLRFAQEEKMSNKSMYKSEQIHKTKVVRYCLSVCVSVCVSVCLPVCLSLCLSESLSVHLSVCLPVHLSIRLSACLSICLSVCLPVCLFCADVAFGVRFHIIYGLPSKKFRQGGGKSDLIPQTNQGLSQNFLPKLYIARQQSAQNGYFLQKLTTKIKTFLASSSPSREYLDEEVNRTTIEIP